MKRLALQNKRVLVLRIGYGPDKFSGLSGNGRLLVIMKVPHASLQRVNLPGLLSLCSSYISYSYFLRVPVIFANFRVNISHSKPNITGSWKNQN